ncbi:hypothetical protein JTB14_001651 [Gonioctena quinquepunctata]|nr:hypothetical protein JTB14_001651 [Gonioctena quinquepunctata]
MNKQDNMESPNRTRSPEELLKISMYPMKNNPFSKEEIKEFLTFYPEVPKVLTNMEPWSRIPEVKEWINESVDYNVLHGTKSRGIATVFAYKALEKSENLTQENIKLAILLGWSIRMIESFATIADDVVDKAETRFGKPCWYRNEHVGHNRALVDCLFLKCGTYHILKTYFSSHPQYVSLFHLFSEVIFNLFYGQILDLMPHNLDNYTNDYYRMLSEGKTGYGMFYISVAAAMLLANITDEQLHREAKDVLLYMGFYYQMHSDFTDCFGDPEELGKTGTDMIEGTCTWPVVKALEKASPYQKEMLKKHYGKNEDESVRIILNIYDELNLRKEFERCEDQIYEEIRSRISRLPKQLTHNLFYTLLDNLYHKKWAA